MQTDLRRIARQFDIKIQNFQRAKHSILAQVYTADDAYILRSRPLLEGAVSRLLEEQALLERVGELVSIQFPKLLSAESGEKYIIEKDLLWTAYPLIKGEILCTWHELEKLDTVAQKNVFITLKEIHTKTKGELLGINSGFRLLSDIRKKISELNADLSGEERARIEKALREVNSIEKGLSEKDPCFIHGDYHPGNIIFHNTGVIGLIDTDWARVGYYLEDLAYTIMMFLRDYREPNFQFREHELEKLMGWYQIPEEHVVQLKEYILLYTLYDLHIFKNLPEVSAQEPYLSYQRSMLSSLCGTF